MVTILVVMDYIVVLRSTNVKERTIQVIRVDRGISGGGKIDKEMKCK